MSELQIDAAMDTVSEAIGKVIVKNGREDGSGARRAVYAALENGDTGSAAAIMGCSEAEAQSLVQRFFGVF